MISFDREQLIIVTGASSGIGRATALLLNELGATVIGIGRNLDRLNETKASAKFPERLFIEQKDLTEDIDGLPTYVASLKNKYGKFYGLVCCAGISELVPIKYVELKDAKKIFNINYFSQLFILKGFCNKRNNIGKGASVVVVSSGITKDLSKGTVAYACSKAALNTAISCAAKEYKDFRINLVLPGYTNTPMLEKMPSIDENYVINSVENVSNFCVFLLSNKSKWITGSEFVCY